MCTKVLDMCLTDVGTAEKIFEAMEDALVSRDISWENCIGLSVDGTSVNIWKYNSIKSSMYVTDRLREDQPYCAGH